MVHVQKDALFDLSLTLCMIFKICSQLSENAIFEKFVKVLSLQKLQPFDCVWSGAPRRSHAHNDVIEKVKDLS